jgi:predicted tellurium resistance membrane protein TerC
MDWLTDPQTWISLITLTVLEIVLGIDNIIFISILAGKLPHEQQGKARTIGLMLALVTRIALLSMIFLLTRLTADLFHVPGFGIIPDHGFSGKDLVMLFGGLFLIWKSIKEIHHSLEGDEGGHDETSGKKISFASVIGTIVFIDILFSLDSVITAVGLVGSGDGAPANHGGMSEPGGKGAISIMITAIILSMIVMLLAAGSISDFVNRHPTIKMLALSFLILVGFVLVADGFGHHVPKGYIYFGMAFSFAVEMLNIKMRKAKKPTEPVKLRSDY